MSALLSVLSNECQVMTSAVLLNVDGLTAHYGAAQILFDVSLTLAPGEIAALIGRNGAGKSTTLKAIMRLITAASRDVSFDGQSIAAAPTHAIAARGLGYVPEDRRIFTDLTVLENLEVGRRAGRDSKATWTPERLYEIFPNLAEMRDRRASHMSGGEQQMLTIARTLMGNPKAILLDEPSEGLSPLIVEQMATAINAMKRDGLAVLLSEQNLAFAASVADRAYIIETGHIRRTGSMTEILGDANVRESYLAV
jgi:branched-chain amino acid transport system ATP-binding protein